MLKNVQPSKFHPVKPFQKLRKFLVKKTMHPRKKSQEKDL